MRNNEEDLESNKRAAVDFYDMIFNQNKPREAMELYAGPYYTQHNPMLEDGIQPVIDYFVKMGLEYPGKKVHFIRVIAEDDKVVMHCRQEWPNDNDWAGMDIFRFEKGKIVEHWDVLQRCPDASQYHHANGMF